MHASPVHFTTRGTAPSVGGNPALSLLRDITATNEDKECILKWASTEPFNGGPAWLLAGEDAPWKAGLSEQQMPNHEEESAENERDEEFVEEELSFHWLPMLGCRASARVHGEPTKVQLAVERFFTEALPAEVQEKTDTNLKVTAFVDMIPVDVEVDLVPEEDLATKVPTMQLIIRPGVRHDVVRFHRLISMAAQQIPACARATFAAEWLDEDGINVPSNDDDFDDDWDLEDDMDVQPCLEVLCSRACESTGVSREEALQSLAEWGRTSASARGALAEVLARYPQLLQEVLVPTDVSPVVGKDALAQLFPLACAFRWAASCLEGAQALTQIPLVASMLTGEDCTNERMPQLVRRVVSKGVEVLKLSLGTCCH